jgi:hypothetical protein
VWNVSATATQKDEIKTFLKALELGEEFGYQNLRLVPIHSKAITDMTHYVTLEEAVRSGYVTITELDGGRVPQVRVTNNTNRYVFLMYGEMLTGGKQNRLVGEDLLLAPYSKNVILPVYCSERRRWVLMDDKFSTYDMAAQPELRSQIAEKVDQGKIWDSINGQMRKLSVSSPTEALQDVYKDRRFQEAAREYTARLEKSPQLARDTVGVAVAVWGKVIAIDIFSNNSLFVDLWPKLLRSYAASATLESEPRVGSPRDTRAKVRELLRKTYEARFEGRRGLDLGEQVTISGGGFTGSALLYNENVVHLSLFPTTEEKGIGPEPRIPVIE